MQVTRNQKSPSTSLFLPGTLDNLQFKPCWTKKAIADEEKGEGTWANFSKAASRLGKSVWSPQRIHRGGGG